MLCLFSVSSIYSQKHSLESVLNEFSKDSLFCNIIPCGNGACDTLLIIDTLDRFKLENLSFREISLERGMVVQFLQKWAVPIFDTPYLVSHKCKLYVHILKRKNTFKLFYFSKASNAPGYVEYRIVKGRLVRIKNVNWGQF